MKLFFWQFCASFVNSKSNKGQCDIQELRKPMNANHWKCNKPIRNDIVSQNSKCEIVCLDGFDVVSAKHRDFHRCKKDGTWQKAERVILFCLPNTDTMDEIQAEKAKYQRLQQEIDILKEDSMICKQDFENFNNKSESLMNEIDSFKQKYEGLKKCLTNQTIESIV